MSILKLAALLTLDGRGFKAGIKEAQSLSSRFAGDAKKQLTGAFGYAALSYAAKQMVDYASKIQDTSTALDISSNALQEQLHWLQQNSGTIEDLIAAYKGLAKARAAALGGDDDKLKIFSALGISPTMLMGMSMEDLFKTSAEAFSNTDFGADRLKVAMELYGRAGAEMLPALSQSLKKASEDAQQFGQIIDAKTVSALEKLGDEISKVGGQLKSIGAEALLVFAKGVTTVITAALQVPSLVDAMAASVAVSITKVDQAMAKIGLGDPEVAKKNLKDAEARLAFARSELQRLSNLHANIYDPNAGTKGKGKGTALFGDEAAMREGQKIWEDIIQMQHDQDEQDKKIEEGKQRSLEDRLSMEKEILRVQLEQMSASERRARNEKLLQDQLDMVSFLEGQGFDAFKEREDALGTLSGLMNGGATTPQNSSLTSVGQWGGRSFVNTSESKLIEHAKNILGAQKEAVTVLNKIEQKKGFTIGGGI